MNTFSKLINSDSLSGNINKDNIVIKDKFVVIFVKKTKSKIIVGHGFDVIII